MMSMINYWSSGLHSGFLASVLLNILFMDLCFRLSAFVYFSRSLICIRHDVLPDFHEAQAFQYKRSVLRSALACEAPVPRRCREFASLMGAVVSLHL